MCFCLGRPCWLSALPPTSFTNLPRYMFAAKYGFFTECLQAMYQTEIEEREVLPADYVLLGLSVATDVIGAYSYIAHKP